MIYVIVFGYFLKIRLPGSDSIWDFSLYFSAAFLPWTAFQSAVIRSTSSIVDNKSYIKKVPFPSEIFPLYTTLAESINLLIGLGIYLILFLILKGIPQPVILLLPVVILLQILFTLGFSFLLSAATVFFRDIPQILGSIFQIWFWATPIVYTFNIVPEEMRWMLFINPIFYLLEIYRSILLYGTLPDLVVSGYFTGLAIFIVIISLRVFARVKRGFSELL